MKRDLDLIRKILLKIEDSDVDEVLSNIRIEGYESDEIAYNVYLLKNAGFIEGEILFGQETVKPIDFMILRMTWQGHEFLDACRNEGIWAKAKEKLRIIGNDVPIEVIKAILIDIMTKQLIGS